MRRWIFMAAALALLFCCGSRAEGQALSSYHKDTRSWTHVYFGRTETLADDTVQDISWRILNVHQNQALLLSDRILFAARIDVQQSVYPGWEQSELYEYLNGEFLDRTFSWPERCVLLRQMDRALCSLPEAEDLKNPQYGFQDAEFRRAVGTEYAKENGLMVFPGRMQDSPYWTRTLSDTLPIAHRRVIKEGKWGYLGVWHEGLGVRPMILMDLEGVTVLSGEGTAESPYTLSLPEPLFPEPVKQTEDEIEQKKARAAFLSEGSKYSDLFPGLTEEGFLPQGTPAFSLEDAENGLWLYASQDLRVEITRKEDLSKKSDPRLWFEAHLFVRPGSGEYLRSFAYGQAKQGTERVEPALIARENRLVFALNTDYYLYRVLRNAKRKIMTVGVVLRQGEILWDDPARKDVRVLPNRDFLALYPDGEMEAYAYNGATARELQKKGASDVLCFGPVLLENGEITKQTLSLDKRLDNDPRSGIGMVENGHYVAILMQGRSRASVGCKLAYFAQLFRDAGCQTAFNLDGGGTACMFFMGQMLNQNNYEEHNRLQNELLGLGQWTEGQQGF